MSKKSSGMQKSYVWAIFHAKQFLLLIFHSGSLWKLAGICADVQASINEIQDAFDHEKEQVKEFKAIVGKAPKPLDQGLSEELNFNKEAHKVASDSNVTLHKAIQVLKNTSCFI